mmetsp:Transcript_25147/g.30672  ORF Transcript_25147/g.30672 Transcript_25147/m.30672 type:complete len:83 (-) Transcript_25147:2175-2423(-)
MPRGMSWTKVEELCLCKSWATTSDETVQGGENSNTYWEVVHEKWDERGCENILQFASKAKGNQIGSIAVPQLLFKSEIRSLA